MFLCCPWVCKVATVRPQMNDSSVCKLTQHSHTHSMWANVSCLYNTLPEFVIWRSYVYGLWFALWLCYGWLPCFHQRKAYITITVVLDIIPCIHFDHDIKQSVCIHVNHACRCTVDVRPTKAQLFNARQALCSTTIDMHIVMRHTKTGDVFFFWIVAFGLSDVTLAHISTNGYMIYLKWRQKSMTTSNICKVRDQRIVVRLSENPKIVILYNSVCVCLRARDSGIKCVRECRRQSTGQSVMLISTWSDTVFTQSNTWKPLMSVTLYAAHCTRTHRL